MRGALAITRHARVRRELADVTAAVLPGAAVPDRRLSEALVRIIGLVVRLHEDHAPDHKGRCSTCGRRRQCLMAEVSAIYVPGVALTCAYARLDERSGGDRSADHLLPGR